MIAYWHELYMFSVMLTAAVDNEQKLCTLRSSFQHAIDALI